MTPQLVLFYVATAVVIFNILTVKIREKNADSLEGKVIELITEKGGEIRAQDVSKIFKIPLYDAKILMRKYVSKGKMQVKRDGKDEVYFLKS
jgi:hypothetical protein